MAERGPEPSSAASTALRPRHKRLGEMLVAQGVISADQFAEVLARQKLDKGSRMGRLLSRIRRSLLRAHLRGAGS